ncbi:hypothetical protein BHM03_00023703 [Ensete ventricosum]|nr:hypothetical protein BHM03_00023703 [Ensete ventricosum]
MNGDGAVDEAHGQPQAAVVPSAADGTLLQCRQLPLHPSLTGGGTPKAKENSAVALQNIHEACSALHANEELRGFQNKFRVCFPCS